jgi:hypothetical protein
MISAPSTFAIMVKIPRAESLHLFVTFVTFVVPHSRFSTKLFGPRTRLNNDSVEHVDFYETDASLQVELAGDRTQKILFLDMLPCQLLVEQPIES